MTAAPVDRLERTYRRLLLAYPRRWRQSPRTDELLGILLDAAEARSGTAGATGQQRVDWKDVADLLVQGLTARARLAADWVPVSVRARTAPLCLASGAGLSIALLVLGEIQWRPSSGYPIILGTVGPFLTLTAGTYIAWLVTLIAATIGSHRVRTAAAALTLVVSAATPVVAHALSLQRAPLPITLALCLFNCGALLAPRHSGPNRLERAVGPLGAVALAVALIRPDHYLLDPRVPDQRFSFYWIIDDGYRLNTLIDHLPVIIAAALALALVVSLVPRQRATLPAVYLASLPWLLLAWWGADMPGSQILSAAALWLAVPAALAMVRGLALARQHA